MADTPDLFKTRDQLISRALKNIGIIEPGEPPSDEDYDTVNDLIDPLLDQLSAEGIVTIDDPEEIELRYYLPLARLLANAAGPDFGSPLNEEAKYRDEAMLRKLTSTRSTGETMKSVYY